MRKYFTPFLLIALFTGFLAISPGCKKEWLPPTLYQDSTLVAGSDSAGYVNGTGTVARFNHPFGLTIDQSGNLYVADQGNSLIRKITPDNTVSTYAGMYNIMGETPTACRFARQLQRSFWCCCGRHRQYIRC